MQKLVNEEDLAALCLQRKLQEPSAAHVNDVASGLGKRGDRFAGAALNRVITIDEIQPNQKVGW